MSESKSPNGEENEENNESVSERIISYGKEIIKKAQGWNGKVSRAQIWALIILGILFLLIGPFVSKVLSYLGLLLIVAGLYLGLRSGGILRKEQVLDNWSILIENSQGRYNEVFQDTENFITASKAPNTEVKIRMIAPGVIGSLFGDRRNFLVIKDQRSSSLRPYQIFVNARDYGNNLDVSWYLTYRPSIFEALLSMFRSRGSAIVLSELDLFEIQDLTAFTTNCHHSTLKAVGNLMLKLNQDPSKIDRKSKGFLGIS